MLSQPTRGLIIRLGDLLTSYSSSCPVNHRSLNGRVVLTHVCSERLRESSNLNEEDDSDTGKLTCRIHRLTTSILARDLRSFEIRISSPVWFESDWPNWIGRACPLLVVSLVKRLKPLSALSGTVGLHRLRLTSSISDHTPVVKCVWGL